MSCTDYLAVRANVPTFDERKSEMGAAVAESVEAVAPEHDGDIQSFFLERTNHAGIKVLSTADSDISSRHEATGVDAICRRRSETSRDEHSSITWTSGLARLMRSRAPRT